MKIKSLLTASTMPTVLASSANASSVLENFPLPAFNRTSRSRKNVTMPGNLTSSIIGQMKPAPTASPENSCMAAFKIVRGASSKAIDALDACAEQTITDARHNLDLATAAYAIAGDTASNAGLIYKAAVSYAKAAVLEHGLRLQDDAGLLPADASPFDHSAHVENSGHVGSPSFQTGELNPEKAFAAFQQLGDHVAISDLFKSLGGKKHARFVEITDVEKVNLYDFHDANWTNVTDPTGQGRIEKALHSGHKLILKFDTDLKGKEKSALNKLPRPNQNDLNMYGNAFVRLIDLSPTFRHYFYSLLDRNGSPEYSIRVNREANSTKAGYDSPGTIGQTILPYHDGPGKPPIPLNKMRKTILHEFTHAVQPGVTRDSDDTTVLRPNLGHSHDREHTAFMGGVINEYNHFLAIASTEPDLADMLGPPIKIDIESDYSENLILAQPEWRTSKASEYTKRASAAVGNNRIDAALKVFSNIATSDQIKIRMYDAQFGKNITHSHVSQYPVAEVILQQMLVEVDRADWFAAKDKGDNPRIRESMGNFLNALVEQGQTDHNGPEWKTTINGVFNYLSMDPAVEIPAYVYADERAEMKSLQGRKAGTGDRKTSAATVGMASAMAAMSVIIAGLSAYIAKQGRRRDQVHPAPAAVPNAFPAAVVVDEPPV